jgi:hypothetical protein
MTSALEHAQSAWQRTLDLIQLYPNRKDYWLHKFDAIWCVSDLLVTRNDTLVHRQFIRPLRSTFS